MNDKKKGLSFEELCTFLQQKGFVYGPEPEIYGGIAGFYTYGPLGKRLKNNVENTIRKVFTKYDFWEVECPTVMPAIVWKASGHLEGFTDPVVICTKCKAQYRADKLIKEKKFKCQNCGTQLPGETRQQNLMMKTTIGTDTESYNRPETATTTYLPFLRYTKHFRDKLPFGIFQIGKAYRNEISPRQFIIRMREFTQAEGQYFINPEDKNNFEQYEKVKNNEYNFYTAKIQEEEKEAEKTTLDKALSKKHIGTKAYAWTLAVAQELFTQMGIPKEKIRFRQHKKDEKAFYASDAWDLEINTNALGWEEFCGIHDRTDYDLKQHEKHSGKELIMNTEKGKVKPHILEIAFGTDRTLYAITDNAYTDDLQRGNKVLKFTPWMAPVQIGVFPLVNKLEEKAEEVYEILKKDFNAVYDRSGSIGRRYARADEQGIPHCITIDFETLDKKDATIRDRDSTEQIRIPLTEINKTIQELTTGQKTWKEVTKGKTVIKQEEKKGSSR
ncbi:glycine--tRNA ligase [Candidatus Woesearchaeota archaeon]|nr:glycine--tRNA ligase [Candidatus Woesearchaeota archaeon]